MEKPVKLVGDTVIGVRHIFAVHRFQKLKNLVSVFLRAEPLQIHEVAVVHRQQVIKVFEVMRRDLAGGVRKIGFLLLKHLPRPPINAFADMPIACACRIDFEMLFQSLHSDAFTKNTFRHRAATDIA